MHNRGHHTRQHRHHEHPAKPILRSRHVPVKIETKLANSEIFLLNHDLTSL